MRGRALAVFLAVAGIFLFASATTFQSLGIVLFSMAGEFHWSDAAAGGGFTVLGLLCCITSLTPIMMIRRIGARWTIVAGGLVLCAGFLLASRTTQLATMYCAAGLFGAAFSLVANTSGIYLIAAWFERRPGRVIGLYLMCGTLGGVVGPPLTDLLVASRAGWRGYWMILCGAGLLLALLCAAAIRDRPDARKPESDESGGAARAGAPTTRAWSYRELLASPQFVVIALAMVATQTALLTVSSIAAAHFARLGAPVGFAAEILGLQALVGTVSTGVSGWLAEHFDPKRLQALGIAAEGIGLALLAAGASAVPAYAFVVLFGIGWSVTQLAVTVLLIRYFGQRSGTAGLSLIWMLSGVAAAGPPLFGQIADRTGSFSTALCALGVLLLPLAFASLMMRPPQRFAHAH